MDLKARLRELNRYAMLDATQKPTMAVRLDGDGQIKVRADLDQWVAWSDLAALLREAEGEQEKVSEAHSIVRTNMEAQRVEDYRSGYSAGWSDGKAGAAMRDAECARLFFCQQVVPNQDPPCPVCGCEARHPGTGTCECPDVKRPAEGTPTPQADRYPIPLNDEQQQAVKAWAADDRLWTTQETAEINLRTFARVILRAAGTPTPDARPEIQTESCPRCGTVCPAGWCGKCHAPFLAPTPDARQGWQPIATAPGRVVVLTLDVNMPATPHRCTIAYKTTLGEWRAVGGVMMATPTHWMPLPAPPDATPEAKK